MAPSTTDEFESGRLFELYTRYVTEPESKRDVYGYTILAVGYLLGMAGMAVYIFGPTGGELNATTFLAREVAFATAGIGLVGTLLGLVLMLPVKRLGLVVGAVGTVMGLAAAAWFVVAYPGNWSVGQPDYSGSIVTLYTAGIALVAGVVVMVPVVTGERSYFTAAREAMGQDHPDVMIGEATRGGLFTLFQRGGDWTWWLLDQSAIAASSDGFLSRLETEDRVDRIKEKVEEAALLDITHAAFRLYQAGEDRWRWLLMQESGNVVADSGDEHPSRQAAEASVNDLKEFGPDAEIITIEEAALETYSDNGHWRWRLVDDDSRPLAEGPDRYDSREPAHAGADAFCDNAADAPLLTVESYGVELYEEADRWHWRLLDAGLAPLGEGSTGYDSKGRVEDAVYDHLDRLGTAEVVAASEPTYDVFEPMAGRWRWRLVTPEGRTVAVDNDAANGAEGASADARAFRSAAPEAAVVEIRDQDFELYRADDAWHWRLVDGDRNVRAHSVDPYDSQSDAADAIEHLREHTPEADLIEFETAAFQIYEADEGQWRWRLIDEDGNVLADSSEGEYESKDGATSAMATLQEYAPDAEQLEIETAAFELFEEAGEWGWRLVDDIGETIARGTRRYPTREDAQEDMDALREEVGGVEARVMDAGIFQVYHDAEDTWWWRFVQPDGSVVATSPDGFGTRHEAEDAIEVLCAEHARGDVATIGRLAVLVDDVGDQWSWELVDHDRNPVAESVRSYGSAAAAREAIADVQSAGDTITVFEIRDAAFVVTGGEGWRWALLDENHDPIASGPDTYDSPEAAEDAVGTVDELAADATFVEYDHAAFEVEETEEGWRWQLIDDDREVVAASTETYATRRSVETTIESVKGELADASILEIERAAFEFHEDDEGWRWRLIDETGTELAASLVTYDSRTDAREAMNTVQEYAPEAWTSVAE
ncbi:MAG TPA: YegP family protein [Halobacteriales archaeon]|nr:YegP family protein [Halobacteriales archaeon]